MKKRTGKGTKTKDMEMGEEVTEKNKYLIFKARVKEYKLERVKQLKYLRTVIINKGQEAVEINERVLKGNTAMGSVLKMFKARKVSKPRYAFTKYAPYGFVRL